MEVELNYKDLDFTFKFDEANVTVKSLKKYLKKSIKTKYDELSSQVDSDLKIKNDLWLLIQEETNLKIFSKESDSLIERDDDYIIKYDKFDEGEGINKRVFQLCAVLIKTPKILKDQHSDKVEDLITKLTGGVEPLKKVNETGNRKIISLSNIIDSDREYLELISTLARNHESEGGVRAPALDRLFSILDVNALNSNIQSNTSNNPLHVPRNMFQPRPTVEPDAQLVQQLGEMGFPEARVRQALIATRNNIENAVEYLSNFDDNEEGSEGPDNNLNNFMINGEDDIGDIDIEIEEDES